MTEPSHDDQPRNPPRVAPRELRVSDADREHVVGILEKAIGQGVLGLDEFTIRTDTALAARTRGELNIVLAELPGLRHPDAAQPSPGRGGTVGNGSVPPRGHDDYLELTAHGSTLKRSGEWAVPGLLVVRNKYGETSLDFTQAQLSSEVVSIDLRCKWGSVTLIVPTDAAVDTNNVTDVKWAAVNDKTYSNRGWGSPRYVISGMVRGGSLTIRNPHHGFSGTW